MDFGIICLPSVENRKDIAFAEANGFTHGWLGDSQMVWADVFQCLALCANDTRKIKLGTNVTNPSSRIAPVTACNFATLNQLAPGRVIMGIGICSLFQPISSDEIRQLGARGWSQWEYHDRVQGRHRGETRCPLRSRDVHAAYKDVFLP